MPKRNLGASVEKPATSSAVRGDKRDRILQAGRTVLAREGLEAATIEEISRRAGVAHGTFYLYFPSKVSLIGALGQQMVERSVVAMRVASHSQHSSLGDRLESIIRAAYVELSAYQDVLTAINAGAGLLDEDEWATIWRPYFEFAETSLLNWREEGRIDPGLDPALTARLLQNFVLSVLQDVRLRGVAPSEEVIAHTARFLRKALEPPRD